MWTLPELGAPLPGVGSALWPFLSWVHVVKSLIFKTFAFNFILSERQRQREKQSSSTSCFICPNVLHNQAEARSLNLSLKQLLGQDHWLLPRLCPSRRQRWDLNPGLPVWEVRMGGTMAALLRAYKYGRAALPSPLLPCLRHWR